MKSVISSSQEERVSNKVFCFQPSLVPCRPSQMPRSPELGPSWIPSPSGFSGRPDWEPDHSESTAPPAATCPTTSDTTSKSQRVCLRLTFSSHFQRQSCVLRVTLTSFSWSRRRIVLFRLIRRRRSRTTMSSATITVIRSPLTKPTAREEWETISLVGNKETKKQMSQQNGRVYTLSYPYWTKSSCELPGSFTST